MIVYVDEFDFFHIVFMDFRNQRQQMHDDLDVFDFLPGLDFTIVSQTVVEQEDRLGIFRHHHDPHFVLEELKV